MENQTAQQVKFVIYEQILDNGGNLKSIGVSEDDEWDKKLQAARQRYFSKEEDKEDTVKGVQDNLIKKITKEK